MNDTFILIPGRTSRQGTTLNEGKLKAEYIEETNTMFMCADDMKRLGVAEKERVRVYSDHGQIEVVCQAAKDGELPSGLLFMPYGDLTSRLMGGETHCTGMPDSKSFDVRVEKIAHKR